MQERLKPYTEALGEAKLSVQGLQPLLNNL
jgi:hypothetical protein